MKSNKLVVPVILGPGIKELDSTTHTTVPDNQYQAIQQNFLPPAGASSRLSRKGNNCIISTVGKHSNVPQVAPRMTREGPYLYCHLSCTILYSVEFPWNCLPWKGRSEGDASTEVIASFYCINTQSPRRNKIDSHISSIFAEKKPTKVQVTKLKTKPKMK